jgi:MFS family permease
MGPRAEQPPPRPLPRISRLVPGTYYGWLVAMGAMVLSFATAGIGFYGQVILLDGLSAVHDWPKASVAWASSLYFVVSGVSGALIGRAIDRSGARAWILTGTLLMAVALVAIGRASSPSQLFLLYPLFAAGTGMASTVPTNAIITRWFVSQRARAMSVSHTGVSLGGIVLVPLATWLIHGEGIGFATSVLAILLLGLALPVTLFVLREEPKRYGLVPDGGREPRLQNPLLSESAQQRIWRARGALQTRTFWVLASAFSGMLFAQLSVLIHQLSFLREQMGPSAAALAVSLTAAASIGGRLLVGVLADRVEKRRLGAGLFLFQACAVLAFSQVDSVHGLYLTAFLFGSTVGSIFMMQALLVGELFGLASFGKLFGLLQLVTGSVAALGPGALGMLQVTLGGYQPGLRIVVGIAVVSAWILSRVPPPAEPDGGA